MNNSELTAYNYGRRLATESVRLTQEGRGQEMPAAAVLSADETASLERLGQDRWWSLVLRGGQDVLGGAGVVPEV